MNRISRKEIETYILTSLGEPIVQVELAPQNIGFAIDTAINEYLSVGSFEQRYAELSMKPNTVNEFQIPDYMGTVKDVTYAIPGQAMAGSTEDIFSFAVYSSPFGPNYTNFVHAAGNLGTFFEYLQNRNRVIGNDITFKVVGDSLFVWPYPKQIPTILVSYSPNPFGLADKEGGISLSNSWGTYWMRRMSLAIAKGMLAKIRGKYSSVAGGPGSETQTLDGQSLAAESKEEIAALKQELVDHISHTQFYIA